MMHATTQSTQIIVSSEDQESYHVEDYPNVQVVICSCTAKSHGIHIRSPESQSKAYTIPDFPQLRSLISAFLPVETARMRFQEEQERIESLLDIKSHFQNLNLISRTGKYIQDPRKIGTLASRARVQTRGFWRCLSFQLIFNIWAVIIWLLIRKTLELFGIRIGPQIASVKSERSRIGTAQDFVGLTRRSSLKAIERRRLMATVEDYNNDSWENLDSFTVGRSFTEYSKT